MSILITILLSVIMKNISGVPFIGKDVKEKEIKLDTGVPIIEIDVEKKEIKLADLLNDGINMTNSEH